MNEKQLTAFFIRPISSLVAGLSILAYSDFHCALIILRLTTTIFPSRSVKTTHCGFIIDPYKHTEFFIYAGDVSIRTKTLNRAVRTF